jgi:putative ABC transport system permease protein
VEAVEKAEVWFTHPASILREGQKTKEAGLGAEIVGIPVESDMFQPLIVAGRWLQPGDERAIVISKDVAEDNDIKLGDILTLDLAVLGEADWQVIGLYQLIFGGGFSTDSVYAPQQAVFRATKTNNQGAQLYVRMRFRDEDYIDAANNELKNLYAERNMDVFYSQTLYEVRQSADSQFGSSAYSSTC